MVALGSDHPAPKHRVMSAIDSLRLNLEEALERAHLWYATAFREGVIERGLAGTRARFRVRSRNEIHRIRTLMGERQFLEEVIGNLRPDDVFFDVGGNIGLFSCFAAKRASQGRVVAFEPHPDNARILRENLQLNGDNFDVHELALSDRAHETQLRVGGPEVGAGAHALSEVADEHTIPCEAIPTDRLIEEGRAPQPTVLKIDVEGGEWRVFKGMEKTLANPACRLVYVELHPAALREHHGVTPDDVLDLLRGHGFHVTILSQRGEETFAKAERLG